MKYRDFETGEFKDIYVKASDTLPIGSIVEIPDDMEVPDGWEEVEEISKEKVLWENPNPTEEFPPKIIHLNEDMNNYIYYEIIYALNSSDDSRVCSTGKISINKLAYLNYIGGSVELLGFARSVESKTNITITFEPARRSNTGAIENNRCVPIKVIGYK